MIELWFVSTQEQYLVVLIFLQIKCKVFVDFRLSA